MSELVNRLKSFVGLGPEYDEDDEFFGELNKSETDYPVADNAALNPIYRDRKRSNIKVLPNSSTGHEVKVVDPRSFEEALDIVNNLRERKSVILNLHMLDAEQSQRIVDFLSGATHALDGHQQRIGEGVFLFTPNNIAINSETDAAGAATEIRDAFWNQAQ